MMNEPMLSDHQVESDAVGEFISSTLSPEQIGHLQQALESDPTLGGILDTLLIKAVEFSDSGEVVGPGDGESDQIPARLSTGEFVFSAKATSVIGVDVLQKLMEDAESQAEAPQQQGEIPEAADTPRTPSLLERSV